MVKHRFSTHDVAAEVGCLKQKFLGMRLANIYDINAKVALKLSVSSLPLSLYLRSCQTKASVVDK